MMRRVFTDVAGLCVANPLHRAGRSGGTPPYFFSMLLLCEVSADAHLLDGMKLSVQEIRVPFFVLEHALK
jgi:hypothetical protein